jgi:hypothetical protein
VPAIQLVDDTGGEFDLFQQPLFPPLNAAAHVAGLGRPWPLSGKAAVTADMVFCLFLTRSRVRQEAGKE